MDDEQAIERTIDLFKALAHPLRVRLVQLLESGPHPVHELVDALDVPQPMVSQHLGVLRTARLVTVDRVGREPRR